VLIVLPSSLWHPSYTCCVSYAGHNHCVLARESEWDSRPVDVLFVFGHVLQGMLVRSEVCIQATFGWNHPDFSKAVPYRYMEAFPRQCRRFYKAYENNYKQPRKVSKVTKCIVSEDTMALLPYNHIWNKRLSSWEATSVQHSMMLVNAGPLWVNNKKRTPLVLCEQHK